MLKTKIHNQGIIKGSSDRVFKITKRLNKKYYVKKIGKELLFIAAKKIKWGKYILGYNY